eukprot:6385543-Amphidinium_carterae.1
MPLIFQSAHLSLDPATLYRLRQTLTCCHLLPLYLTFGDVDHDTVTSQDTTLHELGNAWQVSCPAFEP